MSKYEGVALLKELMAAEAGVYAGRNIVDDLGFTVDEVCQFGEEGTLIEHGIGIGDYFIMQVADHKGVMRSFTMEIAGIDHYTDTMYGSVEHHVDWISKEIAYENVPWNKTNYNNSGYNGDGDTISPFAGSNIKMWLNAESGTTADKKSVDYTTTGFLARLQSSPDPNAQAWARHLKEKYCIMGWRDSSAGNLTEDNDWGAEEIGKLWLPTEVEIWGRVIWGDKTYGAIYGTQYPIFKRNGAIAKRRVDNVSLGYWWAATPHLGSTSGVCFVVNDGCANYRNASSSGCGFPVCGRT